MGLGAYLEWQQVEGTHTNGTIQDNSMVEMTNWKGEKCKKYNTPMPQKWG